MNKLELQEGSFPQNSDECLVEPALLSISGYKIGDYIELAPEEIELTDTINIDDENKEENTNTLISKITRIYFYVKRYK